MKDSSPGEQAIPVVSAPLRTPTQEGQLRRNSVYDHHSVKLMGFDSTRFDCRRLHWQQCAVANVNFVSQNPSDVTESTMRTRLSGCSQCCILCSEAALEQCINLLICSCCLEDAQRTPEEGRACINYWTIAAGAARRCGKIRSIDICPWQEGTDTCSEVYRWVQGGWGYTSFCLHLQVHLAPFVLLPYSHMSYLYTLFTHVILFVHTCMSRLVSTQTKLQTSGCDHSSLTRSRTKPVSKGNNHQADRPAQSSMVVRTGF